MKSIIKSYDVIFWDDTMEELFVLYLQELVKEGVNFTIKGHCAHVTFDRETTRKKISRCLELLETLGKKIPNK